MLALSKISTLIALMSIAFCPGYYLASDLFVTSDNCIACHNRILGPDGEDLSIGADWRAAVMANSSRDPYWQASVRREIQVHPTAAKAIENECAACHMPMSLYESRLSGANGEVFANLPASHAHSRAGRLATDGVSCTVCHQIWNDNFGERSSFVAGFVIDHSSALGRRPLFGPYEVDAGRTRLMQSASLFRPEQALHIQEPELCATCHTLFTHSLDENGEVAGELPEQVPYLEWKHSDYHEVISCQTCHMPEVDGKAPITSVAGQPREQVSRHVFRGGNFFMPKMLNLLRAELAVRASPHELLMASARTAAHLQDAAATVEVEHATVSGSRLEAVVSVSSLAGHKLPTAYPSRRAWLHFVVRDSRGKIVFESGKLNPDGSIKGNDNDNDPTRYEPHYTEITSEDQVQIYEPVLGGSDGAVTTELLTATQYLKDNRILPDGFDKESAGEDIAVHGQARGDQDFTGGSDTIRYIVTLDQGKPPYDVMVKLMYQPIGYRWAQNLRMEEGEEIDRFVDAYDSLAGSSAIVIAE